MKTVEDLIEKLELILNSYIERSPFFGGCSYQLENETVIVNYPVDQVESSLIAHIRENPTNHGVSIG